MGLRMSLQVEPAELAGRLARDAHGRPLGEVETVFADEDGAASRFVGIDTEKGRVVVPVDGAEVDPTVYAIDLPFMADRITRAPTISPDVEELDPETERRVVKHFGGEPEPAAPGRKPLRPRPRPRAGPGAGARARADGRHGAGRAPGAADRAGPDRR